MARHEILGEDLAALELSGGLCRPEDQVLVRTEKIDYSVDESFESGICLLGTEVKSIKDGKLAFPDAFAEVKSGEIWMRNFHISEYAFSPAIFQHDPDRQKKLLLHAQEIKRIDRRVREKGYTLIPLRMYFSDRGYAKLEVGVCRGKHQYDKREALKERDEQRRTARALAERG